MNRTRPAALSVCIWATFFCGPATAASVTKVEPPGWWAAHSINPVRVLVTGRDLTNRVASATASLVPSRVTLSADRRYAFFDLTIAAGARPGKYTLHIGNTPFSFEILRFLPSSGRFRGVSNDDAIYLILPDRFANGDTANDGPLADRGDLRAYHGGDFEGIAQRLGYLKDLGVTTIWITPIYNNSNTVRQASYGRTTGYHGYHPVDLYAVEEHFGDLASFRRLVDAAHSIGLKVMQDQVANHVGPEHPWVEAPPAPDWFHGTARSHRTFRSEMWRLIDPYRGPGPPRDMLEGWFAGELPDLNQNNPEVARYLIQNALWWIGVTGIDAIRQDTVPYVPKAFWQKWLAAIKRQHPAFTVVGEVYSRDPAVLAYFEEVGFRLFDFPLQETLAEVFIEQRELPLIPARLTHDRAYAHPDRLVTLLGLHDMRRIAGRTSLGVIKSAFQFLLTARGAPLIYYGDEIGMRGGGDPDNRRDFPGGWPSDPRDAFEAAGRTADEQALFTHVRRLLHLRGATPALRGGRTVNLHIADKSWVYARHLSGHATAVVALGNPVRFELPDVPWLPGIANVPDALDSSASFRRKRNSIEITGAGVFLVNVVDDTI